MLCVAHCGSNEEGVETVSNGGWIVMSHSLSIPLRSHALGNPQRRMLMHVIANVYDRETLVCKCVKHHGWTASDEWADEMGTGYSHMIGGLSIIQMIHWMGR